MSPFFDDNVTNELKAPLTRDNVKTRSQAGRSLSYVEGWHVIAEANRIFGFGAWNRETIDIKVVAEKPREIGAAKKPGFGVSYVAKVRVTVLGVVREGVGAGHGIDVDLGLAHESAIKEAETDAMKRAFMSFGNPFGLALYDKEQTNVEAPAPKPRAEPIVTSGKANGHAPAVPTPLAENQRTYITDFMTWLGKATDLAQVRGVWREELPSMNELGITGTPLEAELKSAWTARGNALARAAGNPNAPAN
jgi:DNA recombination protein Rad52